MIFRTELVIDEQHGDFGTSNDHDKVYNKREPKNIIELIHPQACHDKEKFNVCRDERDDTSKSHTHLGLQEEIRGWRNCTSNGTGNSRKFNGLGFISKVCTQKHERDGDTTPHCGDNQDV
jgi:hypothetical protein